MEAELVLITLNHQGTDIQVEVDLNTANILLNDEGQAKAFVEQLLNTNNTMSEIAPGTSPGTSAPTTGICSSDEMAIWAGRRPTAKDEEAVAEFLKLRAKYDQLFNDKKTTKMKIWNKIANEMAAQGYSIGDNGAEKCRQKFANMQKQYLSHVKHMKRTGEKKKSPPPFFAELHSILGDKHKINPQNTQDSLEDTEESQHQATSEDEPRDELNDSKIKQASSIKNRFTQSRAKVDRPDTKTEKYMAFLKTEMEQDRNTNIKQFKAIENLLTVQNEQRERMINMFGELVKNQKKRKRRDDSDSDDE